MKSEQQTRTQAHQTGSMTQITTVSPSQRRDTYLLKDVRTRVIDRVRSRQSEIETTIFTRILDAVPDQVGADDVLYMAGLRATITAIVEYVLAGINMETAR